MAGLSLKGLVALLLLLGFLVCFSCFGSSHASGSCDRRASGCGTGGGHHHLGSGHLNQHGRPSRKLKPSSSPKPKPKSSPSPSPQPGPIPSPSPPSSPSAPSPKPASKPSVTPSPGPSPKTPPSPSANTFDVRDYGAKGDGSTDDTKAFLAAWADACKVGASTVVVPSKFQFLVGPISFAGPNCKPNIVFQLDGTIVAPTSAGAWGSGLLQWLEFTKLKGITVQGQGTIEGHGAPWWTSQTQLDDDPLAALNGLPHVKPTALRFYGSSNVVVTGITIQNSPKAHLKFDSCQGVEVAKVTISSPGDSPNTDGIHLQNSVGVTIHDSNLACGDDCVSIQTGCSNVYIHDVSCGPGHGISIGGLGSGNTQAFVSNVTVQDVNMVGTMTAVRIKTWQGGSGAVSNIRFSNVKVSQVQTPIVIDQFYCDAGRCKNQTSAVALSEITYQGVAGTYTVQPVYLACSDSRPCTHLHLNDIQLQLQRGTHPTFGAFCWQAFGDLQPPTQPPIDCLVKSN